MSATFTLNFFRSGINFSKWGSFQLPGLLNFGEFKVKSFSSCYSIVAYSILFNHMFQVDSGITDFKSTKRLIVGALDLIWFWGLLQKKHANPVGRETLLVTKCCSQGLIWLLDCRALPYSIKCLQAPVFVSRWYMNKTDTNYFKTNWISINLFWHVYIWILKNRLWGHH